MGKPVAGEIVVFRFPQTDLKSGKPRPALVLVDLPGDDLILAQITSRARFDGFSIDLGPGDFASGQLPVLSYIRPNRLFTTESSVILRRTGQIEDKKLQAVLAAVRRVFS